jgi:chemotaxis signal transduction protein
METAATNQAIHCLAFTHDDAIVAVEVHRIREVLDPMRISL